MIKRATKLVNLNKANKSVPCIETMADVVTSPEVIPNDANKKTPLKKNKVLKPHQTIDNTESTQTQTTTDIRTSRSTTKAAIARSAKNAPTILVHETTIDAPTHFHKQRLINRNTFIHLFNNNESLGINIEVSIYNYTINEAIQHEIVRKPTHSPFIVAYNNRLRSVWWNIQAHTQLYDALSTGTLLPQSLETMTHVEMNMDKWKKEIDAKFKRERFQYTNTQQACTNAYTCIKCKSTRCTFYTMQIRSSDEPMTVFVACLECGKNWCD